jgi:hypothetical protein
MVIDAGAVLQLLMPNLFAAVSQVSTVTAL